MTLPYTKMLEEPVYACAAGSLLRSFSYKTESFKNMYNSQLQGKEVHVLKTSSVIRERPQPAAWLNPDCCQWSRKCSCAYTQTLLCSWPVTLTLGWSHEAALLCCSSPAAVHPRCAVWNISVSGPCTSAALVNSEVRNAIKENLCLCYCSVCVCVCAGYIVYCQYMNSGK